MCRSALKGRIAGCLRTLYEPLELRLPKTLSVQNCIRRHFPSLIPRRKRHLAQIPHSGMIRNMTTVTITLRDEDQHFIENAMKSGRYVTESEAVADALSELRIRDELPQTR